MASKRSATALAADAKRARQIEDIVTALQAAGPDPLLEMLAIGVDLALMNYKDERHEYQQAVVGWIDEALVEQQAVLSKGVTDAKVNAEAALAETPAREAAVGSAETRYIQLSEAAADAQSKCDAADSQVVAADAALADAKRADEKFTREATSVAANRQQLEALVSDDGAYMKMKAEVAKQKDADAFVRSLKKYKFEEALTHCLPSVCVREPSARTDFDLLVFQHFEKAVAQRIAAQVKLMEEVAAGKQRCAEETAAAQAALAVAREVSEASAAAFRDASAAEKQGDAVLQAAIETLKASGPAAAEAAAAATQAELAVENFCKGPLAAFQELRDRCAPVEPEAPATADVLAEQAGA